MWDFVRAIFGEVTGNELMLVAIIFLCILAFGWAPKAGEAVGAMFDQDND